MSQAVSVIIPIFNESATLKVNLEKIVCLLRPCDELIVVDGESPDGSLHLAREFVDQFRPKLSSVHMLSARKGRANQMNVGARSAKAEILLFLHADTCLTSEAWSEFLTCVDGVKSGVRYWGRFDVRIVGKSIWLPVIAWFMNHRSRLTRIATGDQAIFLTRSLFYRVGGYFDQPLMEDIELCKTLKTQPDAVFLPLNSPVLTSGRRWDDQGAWPTIVMMWRFRFLYWRGANAYDLARKYQDVRQQKLREQCRASELAGVVKAPDDKLPESQ